MILSISFRKLTINFYTNFDGDLYFSRFIAYLKACDSAKSRSVNFKISHLLSGLRFHIHLVKKHLRKVHF